MANRSIAGPIIMLVIGFSLVLFSVSGIIGIRFENIISDWGQIFGDFMGTWGENFGEFMSTWAEGFAALLSGTLTQSAVRILGGAVMLIVGLVVIVASFKALRR
jgi:hypothetical protein